MSLRLVVAGVLSVVIFLVVCVLLYRQTVADQHKPGDNSLDIILQAEN